MIILDSARKHGISDFDMLSVVADPNVIWRRGDGEIPERAKRTIESAQDELLLMSLQLPLEIIDMIRSNASENAQRINDYISSIVVGYFKPAL